MIRKAKTRVWKKFKSKPKKKPVDMTIDVPEISEVVDVPVTPKPVEQALLCDCGKEVLANSYQCWDCSHRS